MIAPPASPRPHTKFELPAGLEAALPPERRGLSRDGVRLLVASPTGLSHHRFSDLPQLLEPGDLVVVNTSATLPAALTAGDANGRRTGVHVSGWLDDTTWMVEVRRAGNGGPDLGVHRADVFHLPAGITLTVASAYPDPTAVVSRLWRVSVSPPTELVAYLSEHGQPIVYRHSFSATPLSDYQTVYAEQPGSAEMASAGRPFTTNVLRRLTSAGVMVAPITLHAGVSSPEFHEPPAPERYSVPAHTARLVAATRDAGGRVVAVGTTVVRALETVAGVDGDIRGASGWTDLVLGPGRPARVVTGLVTGLHLPESSHLLLLEAVAGPSLVCSAYAAAIEAGYLWHEFGDSMLFLP
jgi:S-adenosylmethionine:tRNA ribosyltransferase-isomerase